jgi:hypothetical protein
MHRIQRPLVALALAAGTITPLGLAASSAPAGAICQGTTPVAIVASIGAEQARYSSTCDGDAFYAGQAYDAVSDGYCVAVRYRPHGTSGVGSVQGQACTTGAFTSYNAQGGPFDVRLCRGSSTAPGDCTGWFVHSGF